MNKNQLWIYKILHLLLFSIFNYKYLTYPNKSARVAGNSESPSTVLEPSSIIPSSDVISPVSSVLDCAVDVAVSCGIDFACPSSFVFSVPNVCTFWIQ
jgi:hypothetical protein